MLARLPLSVAILLLVSVTALAHPPQRVSVLLATDIGGAELVDAFALALLLASPEVDLRGVTAVGDPTDTRAAMLSRFLTVTGRRHKSFAAGEAPQPK